MLQQLQHDAAVQRSSEEKKELALTVPRPPGARRHPALHHFSLHLTLSRNLDQPLFCFFFSSHFPISEFSCLSLNPNLCSSVCCVATNHAEFDHPEGNSRELRRKVLRRGGENEDDGEATALHIVLRHAQSTDAWTVQLSAKERREKRRSSRWFLASFKATVGLRA